MDSIAGEWTNSFGSFLLDDFNNNNDGETVIPHCDTHLPGDHLSDISFESREYEETQDNSISLSPPGESRNTLPNGLFEELSDSDLLNFIDSQDLSDVESIQELDTTQSDPPSQPENTKQPINGKSRNIWECVSVCNHDSSTPAFHNIGEKIKAKFGFAPFSWQASAIVDLTYQKRDVFVIAGTNAGKSLTYQAIPEVTGGIVLVISPTIALMEDQQQWLIERDIPAISLISTVVAEDPGIWNRVDKGEYSVILGSPEVLLGSQSPFWKRTVRNRNNAFCQQLACIVIDEAHLIWSWRSFRKEYGMIGHLKSTFPKVPTLALSAIVTPNVLEYVRESLQLRAPVRLYKESLDRPNLTYLVSEIKKPGFEELDFVVSPHMAAFKIPKTMIFVDNIDTAGQLELYLQGRLSPRLQKKARLLIRTFSANLTVDSRSLFLDDFRNGNTRIWICTECAGMGLNLRDVEYVYQWKLSDFIMLPELVQRLGRAGRDVCINAIALVFVESRQCLPISDNDLAGTEFANARQPVSVNNRQDVKRWIATLYEKAALRAKETGASAYHKIDPAILWFVNTTGCRRRMILACFMCTKVFRQMEHTHCCDNCMYKRVPLGDTPDFELQGVTAKMSMRFHQTREWEENRVEEEYMRRVDHEVTKAIKTSDAQRLACETALNNFATCTWPEDCIDELTFPLKWRLKIAKQGAKITSVDDLRQKLKPECRLDTSSLKKWAEELVTMLKTAIENNPTDPPIQQNNRQRLASNNPPNQDQPSPVPAPPSRARPSRTSQNGGPRTIQRLSMHQALISHAATLRTSHPDENAQPATSPSVNWHEPVDTYCFSPEPRHQLIPATPERTIAAGTAFLTSPMRSIQQAMIQAANAHQRTQSTEPDNEHPTSFVQIRRPFMELSGNVQRQPQRHSAFDLVAKNDMLDETAITPAANRRLVATSFCGRVANRAHDPVGSDNMEDTQQEIGSPNDLQYKTPHIDELKANQSKVDTATAATADHPLIATRARGHVANKACVSEKLQQKIRAQAAKFVQNADVQEQAKKRRATQTDNSQPITKRTRQRKE